MAAKRILRYLKGAINYGLMYSRSNDSDDKMMIEYSDAGLADDVNDRTINLWLPIYGEQNTNKLEKQETDLRCT